MNQGLNFSFVPLIFIKSEREIKKHIRNTIIFKEIYNRFKKTIKLKDLLVDTLYGYTASAQDSGNVKFLRITDIKEGSIDWDNVPYCDCDRKDKYMLKKGDILVARTGTTGKSFLANDINLEVVFASYLIRIRVDKEKILPEFLSLFMNSYLYWSQIENLKEGSVQKNVNARKLAELEIPYCDVDLQRKVVKEIKDKNTEKIFNSIEEINSTYDDFIKLNDEFDFQIVTLKLLREAVLREAVQGEFERVELGDVCDFEIGSREKGGAKSEGIPSIGGEQINVDGTIRQEKMKYTSQSHFDNMKRGILKKSDVLVVKDGATTGKAGFYNGEFEKASINEHVFILRSNEKILPKFLYSIIRMEQFQSMLKGYVKGIIGGIGLNIKEIKIPLPSLKEQKKIIEKIEKLFSYCQVLQDEIDNSKEWAERLMKGFLEETFINRRN